MSEEVNELKNQPCPFCHEKKLTLAESERDIPYFGKVYLFSMTCEGCKYHKADIEAAEKGDPVKYTIEIDSEEDMKIRIVKSAEATIKIPHMVTITPGPAANGFITNVEGVLRRVQHQIEEAKEAAEDNSERKKAKNMLKKLQKVMWGQEKLKMIIEDPTGNSAIVSQKAVKNKLR